MLTPKVRAGGASFDVLARDPDAEREKVALWTWLDKFAVDCWFQLLAEERLPILISSTSLRKMDQNPLAATCT